MFLFSVKRFKHEPLARIYRATLSHALTLINGLLLLLLFPNLLNLTPALDSIGCLSKIQEICDSKTHKDHSLLLMCE